MPPAAGLSPLRFAAMLLLAGLWGLSIPVTKLGLEFVPPITLTAMRFGVAVPCLFFLVPGRQRVPLHVLPGMMTLGVLGIGIGQVAQALGVAGASASVSTIISAMIPVFVVIFAALRLGQRVTPIQRIGLAAAFAGIALVALGQNDGAGGMEKTTLAGAALVLLSALTIAFYYVWSVTMTVRHGSVAVAAWSTLAGFLALLPFTAWEIARTPVRFEPSALAAAIYLGVLVSVVGLFLWLWLLRVVPARIAASVQFLQPIVGITASAAVFGDRMGPFFIAGAGMVVAGVALSSVSRSAARR